MNDALRESLTSFTCGPCRADAGNERRAGVLVVLQEPNHDPEVLPFCYRHAGVYVSRWAEPDPPTSITGAFQQLVRAGLLLWRALVGAVLRQAS